MKSTLPLFLSSFSALLFVLPASAEMEAKQLYEKHCTVCHGEPAAGERRLAPPIFAVKNHYLAVHDEELTFVDAIEKWVENPNTDNSLMKGAIRHFNLMPKISVPENELTKIAEYIYSDAVTIPEAYKRHYAQNHGGKKLKQYSRLLLRQLQLQAHQVDQLKLSDTQLEQLNERITDKEALMQPMREEVLGFNRELLNLDTRDPNFKSDIAALADTNAKRVEQMVKTSGAERAKIEAVLDDDQYQILMNFRKERQNRSKK